MPASLLVPADHVDPVGCVDGQGVQLHCPVQRDKVFYDGCVASTLRAIGQVTAGHPGIDEFYRKECTRLLSSLPSLFKHENCAEFVRGS